MSRLNKAAVVATTSTETNPGYGNQPFKIVFTDNWIKRNYMIESPLGVQAYVLGDPVKVAEGYEYTVQMNAVSDKTICPPSELVAGALWSDLNTFNAES